jgi:hypothetical protein
MENTNATESATQDNGTASVETEKQGRTFTQAEVDNIIRKRLSGYADYEELKEKARLYDANEEASKTELQKAQDKARTIQEKYDALVKSNQTQQIRAKVSKETGVPDNLLTGETEEDCKAQAAAILAFANPEQPDPAYPTVRDGGESKAAGDKSPQAAFDRFMSQYFK